MWSSSIVFLQDFRMSTAPISYEYNIYIYTFMIPVKSLQDPSGQYCLEMAEPGQRTCFRLLLSQLSEYPGSRSLYIKSRGPQVWRIRWDHFPLPILGGSKNAANVWYNLEDFLHLTVHDFAFLDEFWSCRLPT